MTRLLTIAADPMGYPPTRFLLKHAPIALPLFTGFWVFWCHLPVFGDFYFRGGDNVSHVLNVFSLKHALSAGDNIFGPMGADFGMPILRFYQPLYYLVVLGLHLISGITLLSAYNVTVAFCFALTPMTYFYFFRKLGLSPLAAAIGGSVSVISVAGFGNSFEAYHANGVVTQSMGALFFPLFLGSFIGMLRGENRVTTTAVLLSLTCLSHAMNSVYALIATVLYVAVSQVQIGKKRPLFLAFGILSFALVSFWMVPFIAHTEQMRPVSDSVIRGHSKQWWFTSLSDKEMIASLYTGRLFDDPQVVHDSQTNPLDKVVDKINIASTRRPRKPVLTMLIGWGCLMTLLMLRRTPHRYLLTGFALSLLIFVGPDDSPWLRTLPFIRYIQSFRVLFLIEIFAFGIVGVGIDRILTLPWRFVPKTQKRVRIPLGMAMLASMAFGIHALTTEIDDLSQTFVSRLEMRNKSHLKKISKKLPNRGYPYRIHAFSGRDNALLGMYGQRPAVTHWKSVGPTTGFISGGRIKKETEYPDFLALFGVRYFFGKNKDTDGIRKKTDEAGNRLYRQLPHLKSRKRKKERTLDSGITDFLRPLAGHPLPIVCSHSQWVWIVDSWMKRFASKVGEDDLVIPFRIEPGTLQEIAIPNRAQAVFYLTDTHIKEDLSTLKTLNKNGTRVSAPFDVPEIKISPIPLDQRLWHVALEQHQGRGSDIRDNELSMSENVAVTSIESRRRTNQRFSYEIRNKAPMAAILPMQGIPGWKAFIDDMPHDLFSAGPDMLGLELPKGEYRLDFKWEMPKRHFFWGLVSLITLLGIVLYWLIIAGRKLARHKIKGRKR